MRGRNRHLDLAFDMNEPLISCHSSRSARVASEMTNERKLTIKVGEIAPIQDFLSNSFPFSLCWRCPSPEVLITCTALYLRWVLRWSICIFGPGRWPDHSLRTGCLVMGRVMVSLFWLYPSHSLVATFKALDSLDLSKLRSCIVLIHFWGRWPPSSWARQDHTRWIFRHTDSNLFSNLTKMLALNEAPVTSTIFYLFPINWKGSFCLKTRSGK